MEISREVRKRMIESNMTIRYLARKANLPEDTIKAILYHRVKDVKLLTAVKLADAFGCSLDELAGRSAFLSAWKK